MVSLTGTTSLHHLTSPQPTSFFKYAFFRTETIIIIYNCDDVGDVGDGCDDSVGKDDEEETVSMLW